MLNVSGCRGDHGQLNGSYTHLQGPNSNTHAGGFSESSQNRFFLKTKLGSGVRVSSRPVFVKDCRAREGEERTCCKPDCWTCGQCTFSRCMHFQICASCYCSAWHRVAEGRSCTSPSAWGPAERSGAVQSHVHAALHEVIRLGGSGRWFISSVSLGSLEVSNTFCLGGSSVPSGRGRWINSARLPTLVPR